ncbi:glycoside hydrolase family 55 protein [Karstenula rhodostoma CBS 690.94]|uniref:Glycoside hydrolase family 55 protein n=1 Tax=Karstenula rhodostoma CBS 690.94 TaxID=1392251 RepID=A0A9P4UCF8_9PLEO|nr:glycoside hydrolase family 55 protein [Karstenula rhodostoma CBS 690.94]
MLDGKRCGKGCNGSTLNNAIVYIPPGTHLISTTIPMPFGCKSLEIKTADQPFWPPNC